MAFIAMAAVLYSIQGWNFKRLNRIRDNLTPEERQQWLDDGAEGDAHPGTFQLYPSVSSIFPLHRDLHRSLCLLSIKFVLRIADQLFSSSSLSRLSIPLLNFVSRLCSRSQLLSLGLY